jgi:hypothetical protein
VRWVHSETGEVLDGIPTPEELPELPASWVEALTVEPAAGPSGPSSGARCDSEAPWEDFRARYSCHDVLVNAGFTEVRRDSRGVHYRRPGKADDGSSATVWADDGTCTPFSSSIDAAAEALTGTRKLNAWNLHVLLNYSTPGSWQASGEDFRRAAAEHRRRINHGATAGPGPTGGGAEGRLHGQFREPGAQELLGQRSALVLGGT